jgi:hypothetical protein
MANGVAFSFLNAAGDFIGSTSYYLLYPANTWLTFGDSMSSNITVDGVAYLSVTFEVELGWVGTVYVDNVQLH